MVTFRLVQECENYAIYHYWAENYEEKNPSEYGILAFDKDTMSYIIIELAPHDFQHIVSIEEQLEMRESANRGGIEEGRPPLTEEEWPMPRSELIFTFLFPTPHGGTSAPLSISLYLPTHHLIPNVYQRLLVLRDGGL